MPTNGLMIDYLAQLSEDMLQTRMIMSYHSSDEQLWGKGHVRSLPTAPVPHTTNDLAITGSEEYSVLGM
jgi:hypothetical protein